MNLSALFNAFQGVVIVEDTDGGMENRVKQEVHTDAPQKSEPCTEPRKRWFERVPEALASILEEKTNNRVVTDEHSANSTMEETKQKGKTKCHLGRGMRALLRD